VVSAPVTVRLRAYQVGFGDCLLLTIRYSGLLVDGRSERHLLIDFGAKTRAPGGPSLAELAPRIAEHCGGHLDVVVATHRHADHVRGFGDAAAKRHLVPLQPSLIIRPWTDGPAEAASVSGHKLDASSRRFLALLDSVGDRGASVVEEFGLERTAAGRVGQLAELGVANQGALDMLGTWTVPDPTVWVRADDQLDAAALLPGVNIRVLGPPTLKEVPRLKSYASTSSEYWLAMTREGVIAPELTTASADDVRAAREEVAAPDGFGSAGWLVDKMHKAGTRQALEIVAGFDEVLNNTSVVLLVTVGDRSLLLTGDAQVENWSYPLDRALGENGRAAEPELHQALASVELYKVGHHGSRNATPRRLVGLWKSRRRDRELCSVLSTRHGVFDKTVQGTVPKKELVDALKELGPVHSTDELPAGVWWFDVSASATGKTETWSYTPGPVMPSPGSGKDDGDEPG
jgi:hypothetical protein